MSPKSSAAEAAGCSHIKDGLRTGHYTEQPGSFPGGYKSISPGDVADFLVRQLLTPRYHRQIVGIYLVLSPTTGPVTSFQELRDELRSILSAGQSELAHAMELVAATPTRT